MQLGSMRVSKADGGQGLDLHRDALLAAGVPPSTCTKIARRAGGTIIPAGRPV